MKIYLSEVNYNKVGVINMDKKFNTRSMIFTIFGDYIRHYDNVIWVGSLIKLMEAFGHNEQAVRAAVSRMSKQGWIQSERRGNRSYYSLTKQGTVRMKEASRRIYNEPKSEWDGNWWMLVYTIPEKKRNLRDSLRKELEWSGFAPLSNSCWITPNNLQEEVFLLADKYNVGNYISFFKASYLGMGDQHSLVDQCWNLEEINSLYSDFIKQYSQKYIIHKNKVQNNEMSDASCFVEKATLVHEYRKFLFVDPGLPSDLLPDVWLGDSATQLFNDYNQLLSAPASRFFESVFELNNLVNTL